MNSSACLMRSAIVFAVLALTAGVVVPRYAAQISAKPATAALAARPVAPVAVPRRSGSMRSRSATWSSAMSPRW